MPGSLPGADRQTKKLTANLDKHPLNWFFLTLQQLERVRYDSSVNAIPYRLGGAGLEGE